MKPDDFPHVVPMDQLGWWQTKTISPLPYITDVLFFHGHLVEKPPDDPLLVTDTWLWVIGTTKRKKRYTTWRRSQILSVQKEQLGLCPFGTWANYRVLPTRITTRNSTRNDRRCVTLEREPIVNEMSVVHSILRPFSSITLHNLYHLTSRSQGFSQSPLYFLCHSYLLRTLK